MELLNDALQTYLEQHCEPEPELLQHISRETNLMVPMAKMLSGHFQGRVLSFLSKIIQPERILEIGSFTGYATLALAEGLKENGRIFTVDINEELEERVRGYFKKSNFGHKITYQVGNALEFIPTLNETFDLVFIDADKKNNGVYYDMIFDKVRKGGLIVVDNVLWSGKVVSDVNDKDTQLIRDFNEKITNDHRVEKLILPIRDGLFIIRKI